MVGWLQARNTMMKRMGRAKVLTLWKLGNRAGEQTQRGRGQGSNGPQGNASMTLQTQPGVHFTNYLSDSQASRTGN